MFIYALFCFMIYKFMIYKKISISADNAKVVVYTNNILCAIIAVMDLNIFIKFIVMGFLLTVTIILVSSKRSS